MRGLCIQSRHSSGRNDYSPTRKANAIERNCLKEILSISESKQISECDVAQRRQPVTGKCSNLDMCCGSRMFWFDKNDDRAIFSDIRKEEHTLCDGRRLIISPDLIADFVHYHLQTHPFRWLYSTLRILERVGDNARMGKKYGRLNKDTGVDDLRQDLKKPFVRCVHPAF